MTEVQQMNDRAKHDARHSNRKVYKTILKVCVIAAASLVIAAGLVLWKNGVPKISMSG